MNYEEKIKPDGLAYFLSQPLRNPQINLWLRVLFISLDPLIFFIFIRHNALAQLPEDCVAQNIRNLEELMRCLKNSILNIALRVNCSQLLCVFSFGC